MTSREIEQNLANVTENLNKEEFIFDFLLAFGFSKTTITRLKKGDFNKSKVAGELLHAGKVFFREGEEGNMLHDIEELAVEERILKHHPRFIILTDFKTLVAKDLKTKANKEFPIEELSKNFAFFLPLTGAEIYKSTNDNKADRDASYELAKLYDILIEDNKELLQGHSHNLNLFLSRLLFCFFAEDTGIFEKEGIFTDSIANHTKENGSDTHIFLTDLFKKLNTQTSDCPAYVADFPYVNGGLFRDDIICPKFSRKSRDILLNCGNLNWDEINPDIFGSMIQAVADPEERSDLGMHYTSVPNILKLIKPLFLDELYEEFEKNYDNSNGLKKLINRMSQIKFFDPACGSGNFLIITYKELRALEIKIIKRLIELNTTGQTELFFTQIKLSQFYGIEIKDFAHEMAMLSLWLSEHQMNKVFEAELMDYGKSEPILPLKESGKIVCGNSARMDWESVCPRTETEEVYVIGNPPYLGSRYQVEEHRNDVEYVLKKLGTYKKLDYISIWFYKGSKYIEGKNAQLAFVSTNSVCQGEQVSLLWPRILNENIEIGFAYQSFKWVNNAKGNAGVTVIILGLRNKSNKTKYLFTENIKKEAKNINAYLADSSSIFISSRNTPLIETYKVESGNRALDNGFLLLSPSEKEEIITKNQEAKKIIKPIIGSAEFFQGKDKFCLWIEEKNIELANSISEIKNRLEKVKKYRSTRDLNDKKKYYQFLSMKMAKETSFFIPTVSSEKREYIPIGIFNNEMVIIDPNFAVYDAEPWLFGVLHSKMHMVWVDAVGGKLETRYRYSAKLCYNTFPFPQIDAKQKELLAHYVYAVLDERSKFPEKTMAWLYNPETMPAGLKNAHHELDRAIERIYRLRPFESDAERLEFLFKLYDEMVKKDTLWAKEKKGRRKKEEKVNIKNRRYEF